MKAVTAPEPVQVVQIDVPEPILSRALERFGQIKVFRGDSASDFESPTEITSPSTRITLQRGLTRYTFIDLTGTTDHWYAVAHYSPGRGETSALGDPFQGIADPALTIVTPQELKVLALFGVNLTDDSGTPYPPEIFEHYIRSAVDIAERTLDIFLYPRVLTAERYDYHRPDYQSDLALELDHIPILSVEGVRLVLPPEQEIITFDPSWVHIAKPSGQMNLIPGGGNLAMIQLGYAASWWAPLLRYGRDYLADVFSVDYTAGFPIGGVPAALKNIVLKLASLGPLNIAGDLIAGAGIASSSLSIDGLSQSISTTSSATNAGYGARIINYTKELQRELKALHGDLHPVNFTVV